MGNKRCEILVSYHKPATLLKSDVFTPIHVGRDIVFGENKDGKLSNKNIDWLQKNLIGDNVGDNISSKNLTFCELTAQYWAWKNSTADYIGFMHYRRHLSFNLDEKFSEDIYGLINNDYLDSYYKNRYGLDDNNIEQIVSKYAIVTVKPWDTHNANSVNNYEHYEFSDSKLHIEDYNRALTILESKYPDYVEDMKSYNASNMGYYTNLFIMRRDIFHQYCEWLFSILFELENELDISNYNAEEARVFGYISEWLFGIFIHHQYRTTSNKILELQRTIVHDPNFIQNPENINICFATDNNYTQHLGVAIASILKNTKTDKNIDIYVITDKTFKKKNWKRLLALKDLRENTNITILKLKDELFESFPVIYHITRATYYRYILSSLFDSLDKIIYLDCDLLVCGDIENLYNINLENNYIGAVQDIAGFENQKRLQLKTDKEFYCNAGVLLMNLSKMREFDIENRLIQTTIDKKDTILWLDQDIINIVMECKIKYLDLSWNFQHFAEDTPYDFEDAIFEKAKRNPNIVHFLGSIKPWDCKNLRLYGGKYFRYLLFTPWKSCIIKYFFKFIILYIKMFLKNIFSIKNSGKYKVYTLFGIKLKVKSKLLEYRMSILNLEKEINSIKGDLKKQQDLNRSIIKFMDNQKVFCDQNR